MATLRKNEISSSVADKLGVSQSQGDVVLNAVLETVQEAVAAGDRVVLTGFGSFETRNIGARSVRSIGGSQAGSLVAVPAHKRVGFKPGKQLASAVEPAWHERVVGRARKIVGGVFNRGDSK